MNQNIAQCLLQLENAAEWKLRLNLDPVIERKDVAHWMHDYSEDPSATLALLQPAIDEGFLELVPEGYRLTQKWYDSLDRRVTIIENRLENISIDL